MESGAGEVAIDLEQTNLVDDQVAGKLEHNVSPVELELELEHENLEPVAVEVSSEE